MYVSTLNVYFIFEKSCFCWRHFVGIFAFDVCVWICCWSFFNNFQWYISLNVCKYNIYYSKSLMIVRNELKKKLWNLCVRVLILILLNKENYQIWVYKQCGSYFCQHETLLFLNHKLSFIIWWCWWKLASIYITFYFIQQQITNFQRQVLCVTGLNVYVEQILNMSKQCENINFSQNFILKNIKKMHPLLFQIKMMITETRLSKQKSKKICTKTAKSL